MNEALLIGSMAIVTFAIRYPILALSGRLKLSPQIVQVLSYVPPTVLTAIVIPAVLMPSSHSIDLSYTNARLVGAIVAVLIGFWRQNLLLTIGVGLLAFFGWQGLLAIL
jgi:branched-subunit amino acid transport protein